MINNLEGLDLVDWSSMGHAYGPADDVPRWLEQMASPDPEIREKAFSSFYSSAHHQGGVYSCTAASLPFLLALADAPRTPDRAAVIRLLLSIGGAALDCGPEDVYYSPSGHASTPHADVVPRIRERFDDFVRHAADPDPRVRQAAVPALGLFLDDADRALVLLRERLAAESGTVERLLVIEAAAALAKRLATALGPVATWLTTLAMDPALDADIRLAALVHRAACTPTAIDAELVPTAIGLLQRLTPAPEPEDGAVEADSEDGTRPANCGQCTCVDTPVEPAPVQGARPQLAAIFDDLDRHGRIHAPTTELLTTLHQVLDARVPQRTALLTAQLRSPDAATRHDAIPMAWDLIRSWRGDHTGLVLLLADRLRPDDPYTAAEAAETLGKLPAALAEPAREALAALVETHRTTHGPNVWAARHPLLRRAHQQAVTALACLGDERALPCLLAALDTGTDDWRALQVVGHLPRAVGELLPRVTGRLADADFSWPWGSAPTLMAAVGRLGDPVAVPALTKALTIAMKQEHWRTAGAALYNLGSIGTSAAAALETIRPLAGAEDPDLRLAATKALWDIQGDPADTVPRLTTLLDTGNNHDAADLLGRIGAPAAEALPRLRQMLEAGHPVTRVYAAAAIYDIGGPAQLGTVLPVLLEAWKENDSTAGRVLDCLRRMGPAAAPALPTVCAELALARRGGGYFGSVADDEALQHAGWAVIRQTA
ncbi:HEAT repeat domain-containing protein [Kitasatospora indigofera]|uniref:HEAT repeat domain-containing protein n=1 Tax=Kitasatospora indigofera TaxID=67307 RepID=UPI0036C2FAEF